MVVYTDTNGVGYTYTVPASGTTSTASISGYTGSGTTVTPLGSFVVEAVTYSVTSVAINAFLSKTLITSITLPSSVTSIGATAFKGCTGITSFTISSLVTSIDTNAFQNCRGLTSLTVNSYLVSLGSAINLMGSTNLAITFDYSGAIPNSACSGMTGLKSVTIGPNITSIGASAFQDCSGLTTFTIGPNITSIGANAFRNCSVLTSFTIPSSVTSIGGRALEGCFGLTSLIVNSYLVSLGAAITVLGVTNLAMTFDYTGAIQDSICLSLTGLKSVTIGPNITSIGASAFRGCTNISSLSIPSSVTSIGNRAFEGCSGITNGLTIPSSVTSIGATAFQGCTKLTSLFIPSSVKSIGAGTFNGCIGITGSVIITSSVTSIGANAFQNCRGITSLTVNSYLANLGSAISLIGSINLAITFDYTGAIPDSACSGMTGVNSFTIGPNITSIGNYAFQGCSGITTLTIPSSVTSIGASAFLNCTGLTSLTIPSSVTSIGGSALVNCSGITRLIVNSYLVDLRTAINLTGVLYLNNPNLAITFDYAGPIPDGLCYSMSNLKSVTFGPNITSIGDGAFNTSGITGTIIIPSLVTYIGIDAFQYCTGITGSLTIPSSVTSIGGNAFGSCTGLTSVTVFNAEASIGAYAFINCTGLTSATLPSLATSISEYMFVGCTSLTSITIPSTVTIIYGAAFSDCSALSSVYFLNSVIPTIEGSFEYLNDTAYYISTATNTSALEGLFETTVSVVPPDAPAINDVTLSGTTATINFTAGASNGSLPITSYKYAYSTTTSNGTYTSFIPSNWTTGTSFTVPDLSTGTTYYFKIIASNGIDSDASSASNVVSYFNFAPNTPSINSVTVLGKTATINFTADESNGSLPITSYKYSYSTTTSTGTYTSFITSNWTTGTSFTVPNLIIGTYYFKIIANNGIDSAASSASSSATVVSDNPAINSVTVSKTTVTINFTEGVTNGSPITSYKYAVSINGGAYGSYITSNWTSESSFTVPELIVGNAYNFKIRSVNSINIDSDESIASNQVTVANFAPEAPTDISASLSSGTATINFTAGLENGSLSITRYDYAVNTNGGGFGAFTTSNWSFGSSFTVPGLNTGNNYSFKIKAFNGILSSESPTSNDVTVSNFAPNAPTITSVTVSGTTITINFTAGVVNGSSAITSYKYAYSTTTSTGTYTSFINSNWTTGNSFTVPDLSSGTYYFKIIANNGIDSSESSASSAATVANFAPNAPAINDVTVSGSTVTINFTEGVVNGSLPITSYKYAYSTTTSSGTYTSFITSNWTTGTSFTVPDLPTETTYYFKIVANNGIDSSESPTSSAVSVLNYAPNTPSINSVIVSETTVTINFTAGAPNGSSSIKSYKYAYSTTTSTGTYTSFITSNWTTGTSFTVSNLSTGTTYYFKIIANNGIDSDASSASSAATIANFAPNTPSINSVTVSGKTATINFTTDESNGSSAITSYKYAYSTTTSTGTYTSFINSNWTTGNSFTVPNLIIGTTYYFKIIANNGINSATSTASSAVTVSNFAPNAPTITSVPVTGKNARINFTIVANGSNAITSYKYAYSTTTSTGTYTSFITSNWTTGTNFTVPNLIPGTYYFKIIANNGIDSSESSASSAATVANFAPNAPVINDVTVSGTTVTINFTEGVSNGSLPITSYKYAYSTTTSTGTYTSFINSNWTTGTSFTVSDLSSGTYYFKIIANNGINSAASTASSAVSVLNYAPNAPSINSVTVSETTATINFTAGAPNGSSSIKSYKYAYSTTTSTGTYTSFITSNWTTGTSFTVSNLSTGTTYYFKIIANNGIDSDASSASSATTVFNFAPAAPTSISASVSSGTVTITFTDGVANGSNSITRYDYTVSTNGGAYGSYITSNWSSDTSFTVPGLTIGNNYSFKIKAFNDIFSSESPASTAVTVSNFAPNEPTNLIASVSGTKGTINFTAGESNGSLPITSYKYALSTNGGEYGSYITSNWSSGTSFTVSGLIIGNTYSFKMKANNGLESLESSDSNSIVVIPDAPKPPIIKKVELSGLLSAIINFTQEATSASDITSYQYAFKTSVGGSYSSYRNSNLSWTSGKFSLIISNLTEGVTYYFKLKAYKNAISSIESNESNSLFMNYAPATPQISTIDAFNGTATINFSISNNGSNAVTKYMYSTDTVVTSNSVFNDFPLINGLVQIVSPLIINRLINGTTYSLTIRAFNGINSQASNTINNIAMSAAQKAPRIVSGQLKEGTATIVFEQTINNNLSAITNYAHSTNGRNFTSFSPAQTTSPLIITGISGSSNVSFTIQAINGPNSFSNISNSITLTPILRQPAPTIVTSDVTAENDVAKIPFSQTLDSYNGTDAIIKYVYCTDTNITDSSVFIDVPLRDGLVQTSSPFFIPYTISNPEITPSLSFTFKSYTNSGIYSLASTTATISLLYAQPPPIITSVVGDGIGTATITINQANVYSYAPSIINYAFSTDLVNFTYFDPPQTTGPFQIHGLTEPNHNFIFKSFNGADSVASNTVENVLINYSPPPVPVITSAGGSTGQAYIYFDQDTTGLQKDITNFYYRLNDTGPFINLNITPSSRTFIISGITTIRNKIVMKSSNGLFSDTSEPLTFIMYSLDRATYVDPVDII